MKLVDALQGVSLLFLDTSPVIYQVEQNPAYSGLVAAIFQEVDNGQIGAVTSPVTLAECLIFPYRLAATAQIQKFTRLIVGGRNTQFVTIGQSAGEKAAELRARYNLLLPDALQVAVALTSGCDALLTNDRGLQRVTELKILILDDLTL